MSNTTNAYVAGDWRNRASAPVPDASSFTRVGTTYASADANSTFATGTLNGQTLGWTTTYSSAANASTGSTVTYTFSRPVTNLVVRVQDIDAVFVPANPGGLLGIGATPSNGFTDEVTFTATNGATTNIQPTLTRANAVTKYVAIAGNKATGIPAGGNNATTDDATVIATYPGTITSFTLLYRNVTTATQLQGQVVGIDNISWCRIAPTATAVTTTAVISSTTQVGIRSLSGTADGILSYEVLTLPTNGTLLYNSTGTTYVPVAANQTLTAAQAASLRYTPDPTFTGSTTGFTYRAKDDVNLTSPTVSYTIPLRYIAPCGTTTNSIAFGSRPAGEDWKSHAALAVPTGATTTISSGAYSVSTPNTAATLQIGSVNSNTLAWNSDYSGAGRTSKVTFTFSREVSNFTMQVQDIDGAVGSFIDVVTFEGANTANASVTPFLSVANPSAGVVTVSGNVATGQTATTSTVDGTVTAYFPNPIKTVTITYANGVPSTVTDPGSQFIGIDNMSWCRLAPVANNVTTATVLSTATQASISSLSGSNPDGGTIASYVITSLPATGTLLYATAGGSYAPVAVNQSLTAAQAASLRYAANPSNMGTSTTFTYRAVDEVGASSTSTATYTIPLQYVTPCGTATNTFAFGSRPAGEDWKGRAALAVPTGATTTISSGAYSASTTNPAGTLQIGTVNTVNSLSWSNDYSGAGRTSSVTFTFSRAISNFTTRVLDIDGAAGNFIDVVTFAGALNGTSVAPYLAAENPNAGVVTISGATATGQTSTESPIDGTVTVSFPTAINTLTITYANGVPSTVTDPGFQNIGIENMSWCRLAPTASNVTVASMSNASDQLPISSLSSAAPDGTIKSYTIAALPPSSQGVLYVNGVLLNTTNFPGLVLTPAQAAQLTFDPAAGFVGTSTFNYLATDDANVASTSASYSIPVSAVPPPAVCASPAKDGSTFAAVPNTYYPGVGTAAAGATQLSLGALRSGGSTTPIVANDLLLVIQMQGADIDNSNTSSYGDGVTGGGANGNLTTNFTAGQYEYVTASGPVSGGVVNINSKLVNSYATSSTTIGSGPTVALRTFQVIRIPQYSNLTLTANIVPPTWDGSTGGIVALDVAGQLNMNGNAINVSGAGFRGGAGRILKGDNTAGLASTDYRQLAAIAANGQKGEGTAGTPRYVFDGGILKDTNVNGYPNGSSGRGAPGNAGGGGTDATPTDNAQNDGGGGGANGGPGGRGGNSWSSNAASGGEPGAAFTPAAPNRLILGGGGGAGSTNDGSGNTAKDGLASSGAAGGGIVLLRAGSITGTGTLAADGASASDAVITDGSGGGGAGGSILVTASTTSNLTLTANGGKGGSNTPGTAGAHGPGGGGGGGVIFTTSGVVATTTVAAGANGTTSTGAFGAAAGTAGAVNRSINNSIASSTAGANCVADVVAAISGPATLGAGQPTGTFTATFSNIGAGAAASVTQRVTLPAGAALTAAQRATIVAAYPGTTFTTTGTGTSAVTVIDFGTLAQIASGASFAYSFVFTAPTTTGSVTTTSTTSTSTQELGLTANNSASTPSTVGDAADVTVALSGPTTLNAGQPTGTFTATFSNQGPSAAANVARLVTLPSGATVSPTQQTAILAAYPGASFATAGVIDFGTTSLANNASSVVQFAFTAPTATGTSALGSSTSTTTSEGANIAPNTSSLTLNTVATADVATAITTSATATTGTFQVTFSNNGPQTAAGIVRTVQLPAGLTGLTLSDNDASYDPATGLVTYAASPDIATGSTLTTTITYNLASSATPAIATATVSTTTNEAGLTANNSKTAVMPAQFDLATTLTGPTTTIAGSPTTLYVTTTNNGPNNAPVASQTITIPSAMQLTNVYITNGGMYVYNTNLKVGTVTFPAIPDLASGVTVANSVSFSAPGADFAPSAMVAPTAGDTNTGNNTAYLNGSPSSTTSVAVTPATLAKTNEATTITADATIVSAGTVVTYTVKAIDQGFLNTTSVANVATQVQLIPGLSAASLTVGGTSGTLSGNLLTFTTANGTTTYNPTTGLLTYPVLATQASGSTFTYDLLAVTVPANVGNNGQFLATASVSTANSDPTPADNTSSVVVKVLTPTDLTASITGPGTSSAGQTATYTATFTNQGTGSATSVVETAQLPAGLDNVVVQYASGNVIAGAYNKATGLVTFPTLDNAPAGSSQVYNILLPTPAQSFSVSSFVSSGTTDVATTNNTALLRTVVSPTADVAVYVSGPPTAVAGNAVTYAVTTTNNGPNTASGVLGTLQLPAGLTGVSITSGGTYDAVTGLVSFPSQTLAAGESTVGLVTFTMPTNATNSQLSAVASVSTTSTDLGAGNNTLAITTDVAPATTDTADLSVDITPPVSPAIAGTKISYTLSFNNNSTTTPAVRVMPTAYLPAGLQNVIVTAADGTVIANAYNSTTGQIMLPTIGSQAAGSQVKYTVSLSAPTTAVVISASAVSSNTSDPDPSNNVKGSTLSITPAYDVVTSLTGPVSAQPGSVNTYSVTTTNNGPSTSSATAGSTTQTVQVTPGAQVSGLPVGASYDSGTGIITFPAVSSQAAGTNGAITNTFMVVMPATGQLDLLATVTAAGESTTNNNTAALVTKQANQAPVAQNVWNTLQSARGNTATQLLISPLTATDPDGTISRYKILTLPTTPQGVQGTLYLSDGSEVLAGQTVPAAGLYFVPAPGFVGNATFTYQATDNGGAISNTALYTIPVAQDAASTYNTYNTTKGNSNPYVTGDVLAQAADPNAATYNGNGVIYDNLGVMQAGAANGIASAVLASGTLPTGVSLDPATGRIYVSNANLLPRVTQATNYTVQVTTTDANGGISTTPVTLVIGANPLPVSLTEFTAQAVANRDALLGWATASEAHNDHFEVERSFDGTTFTKIGQVAGGGTTAAASTYTFTDANVAAQATGPVYYRLRQVDLDGTATYSPLRTISFTRVAGIKLSLYPNPAQANTTLDLSALPATGTYQVLLLDATGRTVRTATLGGGLPQPLPIADLATGTYQVLVTGQLADGTALRQVLRLLKN